MHSTTGFLAAAAAALLSAACEPTSTAANDHSPQVASSISLERLARIEEHLQREVDAGVRAGFVGMIRTISSTIS